MKCGAFDGEKNELGILWNYGTFVLLSGFSETLSVRPFRDFFPANLETTLLAIQR